MVGEVIPYYALRVSDMERGNVELIGICHPCGRRGIIAMKDVLRHFPAYAYVEQIEPRLRCWRCRGRGYLTRRTLEPGDPFYRTPPQR